MIIIYQFFLFIILVVAGPFLLLKKKARAGLKQKLGFVPNEIKEISHKLEKCIWIHAVSVGEFNAVFPLVQKIKEEYPDAPVVISTTTATGQKIAIDKAESLAKIIYFPFDLTFAINPWLDVLKPACVIIVETELWPGFVQECTRRKISILSVNARISPSSFIWYRRFRYFFGPVLKQFSKIGVQSKNEKHRFINCGAREEQTEILGNIKLDGLKPVPGTAINELASKLSLTEDDFVIVAGSTHEGEELALLSLVKALKNIEDDKKPIKLIIAPRHPERFERVANIVNESGFKLARYSQNGNMSDPESVYLLDVLGQLTTFYAVAKVAFVGGTIAPVGGHNVAEPYANEVPVFCGPNIQKTKDIANELLDCKALMLGKNKEDYTEIVKQLYLNESERLVLGERGSIWLKENQGACLRAFNMVQPYLQKKSFIKQ